jgi:hypothetical protein
MIDSDLRPYLIEINQMPSFATDAPLDYKVKKGLIHDVMKTLNLTVNRKHQYKEERKAKLQDRLLNNNKLTAGNKEDKDDAVDNAEI